MGARDSRKSSTLGYAASNSSTRPRSCWSPPHAWSRYRARSSGDGMASADQNRDSVRGFASDIAGTLRRVPTERSGNGGRRASTDERFLFRAGVGLPGQGAVQPGLGVPPVAVGGGARDPQQVGGLLDRQTREEA